MITGVCKYCRCSTLRPCLGGCMWVDEEETICSSCLPQCSGEELLRANVLDHQAADGLPFPVLLASVELAALVGLVQLALRHPDVPPVTRDIGQGFASQVAEYFASQGLLSLAELIRRGLPAEVTEPQQPQPDSRIIVP